MTDSAQIGPGDRATPAAAYADASAIYSELGRLTEALESMYRDGRLTLWNGGRNELREVVTRALDRLTQAREACSRLETDQRLGN